MRAGRIGSLTTQAILVSDYGDEDGSNPLLYDYFGFPQPLYDEVKFSSHGNSALAKRIVELFTKARADAGIPAQVSDMQGRLESKPAPAPRAKPVGRMDAASQVQDSTTASSCRSSTCSAPRSTRSPSSK